MLTGTIPSTLFEHLTNLEVVNLRSNSLSGPIPANIQYLTNLEELYIYNNDLTSTFPTEFGLLTNLRKFLWDGWAES